MEHDEKIKVALAVCEVLSPRLDPENRAEPTRWFNELLGSERSDA